jgi:valyl-tRNA synthetase
VEIKKLRIQRGEGAHGHLINLLRVFEQALRLLHPVMPFLTEELWQRLVKREDGVPESIAITPFPREKAEWANDAAARDFSLIQILITEARALRAEQKLDPKQKLDGVIRPAGEGPRELFASEMAVIEALTNMRFEIAAEIDGAVRSRPEFDVALRLSAAQAGAEKQRLEKEIESLRKAVESKRKQLGSESFIGRAPAAVVEETRAKLAEQEAQLALSEDRLRQLES